MALSEERLKELASRMAKAMGTETSTPRPHLRLVTCTTAVRQLDDLTRESHCRMIRHLRRRWGFPMQMIIDQAVFGLAGVEQLDDEALIQLHRDLERAQDCMRDGISFEDAGLLRAQF
ncbi:hypothetical protein [Stenotrophomonas maltophilia]|uniref:hypothetical protein n=1 Tax=Stenotrophomonas maltophilia TaxID=40324 RepID=UPI0039C42058